MGNKNGAGKLPKLIEKIGDKLQDIDTNSDKIRLVDSIFDIFDYDKNNVLSIDELESFLEQLHSTLCENKKPSASELQLAKEFVLDKFDKNHDKLISRQVRFFEKHFLSVTDIWIVLTFFFLKNVYHDRSFMPRYCPF